MLLNTMLLLSGGDFFSRWLEGWNLGGLITRAYRRWL